MEKLWAPWRMKYILNEEPEDGCVFCNRLSATDDRKNLILRRAKHAFIIMNKFPYNSGHVMVVPKRHLGDFLQLTAEEHAEIARLLQATIAAMEKALAPHGYNMGMNLGRTAGAGIEDHIHYHIVPRWNGDTNFMPVLAETKVISESLENTYEKLRIALDEVLND